VNAGQRLVIQFQMRTLVQMAKTQILAQPVLKTYYVECCDNAGNCASDSDTISIVLDANAPTINF